MQFETQTATETHASSSRPQRKTIPTLAHTFLVLCASCFAWTDCAEAEDTNRFRPYIRFHDGDLGSIWGVDDMWSFSAGANFSRHWGGELTLDFIERDFDYAPVGTLGEVSAWNFVPTLRLRQPMLRDQLVPYVIGGIGPAFLQMNDRKQPAFNTPVEIEGWTYAAEIGAGIEYFIDDNITFGVEAKYIYINPIQGTVSGQKIDVDISSTTFTFGLRVYFDENRPRPLVTMKEPGLFRMYFGIHVGQSVLTEQDWVPGVTVSPEVSAWGGKLNETGGLMLGADIGSNWGLELTVDSLEDNINATGLGTLGEYGMGIAIPHVRYRHPLGGGRWVPYAMAGAGFAYGEFNDAKPGSVGHTVKAKGVYPAAGVGAGVEYFVVRNFSLSADARWVYTWNHEINIDNTFMGKGDFSMIQFCLGFRIYFFDSARKL